MPVTFKYSQPLSLIRALDSRNSFSSSMEAPNGQKARNLPRRTCKFYITAKKRNCSLLAMKDHELCAEHITNVGLTPDSYYYRVPCPYNSNHTCFARQLKDHKKRCNYRPVEPPGYYQKGLNSLSLQVPDTNLVGKSLVDLDSSEMRELVKKINDVFATQVPGISNHAGSFELPEITEHLMDPLRGKYAKRQVQQNSALLHLLEAANLLNESTTFVEFGSGKGALTYWLAQALETKIDSTKTCNLLLIDKESHRHKKENKLKPQKFNVERVRLDICDLKLDEIPCVQNAKNVVGICKHLCGDATDMALRCLMQTNFMAPQNLAGLVMATCCHHRCSWLSFVGAQYLLEWGIEEEDFRPLTCLTSWAVCGTGTGGFNEHDLNCTSVPTNMYEAATNLTTADRRMIGYKAKQILDYARCCFIRKYICNVYLTTFTEYEETLENIAIVGSLYCAESDESDNESSEDA